MYVGREGCRELWGSVRREIYGGKEVGKKCREGS